MKNCPKRNQRKPKEVDMTRENQRYFGDWVDFHGHMDVGYYLGTRFVRFMMETDSFDNIINYRLNKVKEEFNRFGKRLYE